MRSDIDQWNKIQSPYINHMTGLIKGANKMQWEKYIFQQMMPGSLDIHMPNNADPYHIYKITLRLLKP